MHLNLPMSHGDDTNNMLLTEDGDKYLISQTTMVSMLIVARLYLDLFVNFVSFKALTIVAP